VADKAKLAEILTNWSNEFTDIPRVNKHNRLAELNWLAEEQLFSPSGGPPRGDPRFVDGYFRRLCSLPQCQVHGFIAIAGVTGQPSLSLGASWAVSDRAP
jgi:hypothetical protein